MDKALNEGDLKQASRLRYELLDWKETLGGLEGLGKYLDYVKERLVEERKKAREQATVLSSTQ